MAWSLRYPSTLHGIADGYRKLHPSSVEPNDQKVNSRFTVGVEVRVPRPPSTPNLLCQYS